MLILWGTKGFVKDGGMSVDPTPCLSCGAQGTKKLFRVRNWFTLFFIPIFPFSSKYIVKCTRCGREDVVKAAKEEFNQNLRESKQLKLPE